MAAPRANQNAVRHGASGTERRIEKGLPLAESDHRRRTEIIRDMGYDPGALPAGPLGLLVDLVADDVLIAYRHREARQWAAERGDEEAYFRLSQRGGWRNDKAIGQLFELMKLQAGTPDALDYERILEGQKNGD